MNSVKSQKPKKTAAVVSSRVNRKTNGKAKKDPNAPKKAVSAFLLFSNDKRAEIRATNPDLKMPDVARECGRLWKEIDDNTKAKYQKIANEDKKRYEQEIKEYHKDKD